MYEVGNIVQITNEKHHWYPCLIIVSDPKSWGVQGYISIPQTNRSDVGNSYIKVKNEDIDKCGHAILIA